MKLTRFGLAALLGTLVPVSAIERPKGEKDGKPARNVPILPAEPQGGILEDSPPVDPARPQAMPEAQAEKVAFLGVGGIETDEALKHQLELEGGLLLSQIDPNSPAGLAGLAQHDIIVSLDGISLTDQDSLRRVLSGHRPGDEVLMKIVRRGEDIEQKVTLGESEAVPNVQGLIPGQARDLNQLMRDQLGRQLGGFDNEQLRKQLLDEMERAFGPDGAKDVREFKFDLGGGNLFNGADRKLGLHGTGSMSLQDNEGSIGMKMNNGSQELTIRDSDGTLLFTGPYDSDVDKGAVPDEYRDRVERLLGNDGSGGFRLKMGDLRKHLPGAKEKKGE